MPIRTDNPNTPRVEGVQLVAYVGKGLDLNSVGQRVGGYMAGSIGASFSHDVYDVPLRAFHPFVQQRVPDKIASSPDGQVLRLYVPTSNRGQITDIGLVNGVYAAPGAPFVPRSGGKIYTAPADDIKYRRVAPARVQGQPEPWPGTQDWRPGPGDRFNVIEVG